ncbi:MAG: polysaccharide biosynthesis/export family protein [Pseudomonadota bacterium]
MVSWSVAPLAEEFSLASGDQVELSVFARPDLSRVYRVRSDGTVSLHIAGSIKAAGLRPAEFEQAVEDRLSATFSEDVSATVEVAVWRPVTVTGDVARPGPVTFQAGTDVRVAIALAGGPFRPNVTLLDGIRLQMQVQKEAARAAEQESRIAVLLIQKKRLLAERENRALATQDPHIAALVGQNTAMTLAQGQLRVQDARAAELDIVMDNSFALQRLAIDEAGAYQDRQRVVSNTLALTLDELAEQENLLDRGLGLSMNVFDLRLIAGELRAEGLEAIGLKASARQIAQSAQSDVRLTQAARQREIAQQLAMIDAELAEAETSLREAQNFVATFGGADALTGALAFKEIYTVHRREAGKLREFLATPDTFLQPGDHLTVTRQKTE